MNRRDLLKLGPFALVGALFLHKRAEIARAEPIIPSISSDSLYEQAIASPYFIDIRDYRVRSTSPFRNYRHMPDDVVYEWIHAQRALYVTRTGKGVYALSLIDEPTAISVVTSMHAADDTIAAFKRELVLNLDAMHSTLDRYVTM